MRLRPTTLVAPLIAAVVVLVVALALAKGGAAPAARGTAADASAARIESGHVRVKIYMFAYEPDTLTVKAGTTITFHNMDMTAHTATALSGAFGTGTIDPGQSRSITVKRPGTYAYHCLFHAFMTGTIKVVG